MKQVGKVSIRPAQSEELTKVYTLITSNDEWTKYNGPYFPYSHPTIEEFTDGTFQRLVTGTEIQLVTVDDVPVGTVSCYWECEATRWLEAGIIVYDSEYWGLGIAAVAVPQWISYLFETKELERVGMTTWSGNPRMISLAAKLGLKQEAWLRNVRYYQGSYYDSVKFGVTRSEWEARN